MSRAKWTSLRFGLSVIALLTVGWLVFVVSLDIAYGMFPRVLSGGIKILIAGYLVLLLVLAVTYLVRGLLRRLRA